MAKIPTDLMQRLGIDLPIVQAPMVGASSAAMAVAAANAGALGSFAVGTMTPDAIRDNIGALRAQTVRPININMFVLDTPQPNDRELQRAFELLNPIHAELGLPPAQPLAKYCENFRDQLDAVIALKPAITSFTFNVLDASSIERLHAAGSIVIGTATNVAEAQAWEANGADVICAQGGEAGGHRGTFIGNLDDGLIGTMALVPQIVDAVRLPVIAAGGIMDGRGIAASLALGAQAAQLGTAFLNCREAVCHASWKALLRQARDTSTRTTRAFSGRFARGLENDYMRRMAAFQYELPAYPVQNALTTDLRQAAMKADRPEFLSLWAGQGAGMIKRRPAEIGTAELVAELAKELREAAGIALPG